MISPLILSTDKGSNNYRKILVSKNVTFEIFLLNLVRPKNNFLQVFGNTILYCLDDVIKPHHSKTARDACDSAGWFEWFQVVKCIIINACGITSQ